MIKLFYQGDQDELLAQCAGHMTNLVRTDSLYKQASSACFSAQDIRDNAPDKDHFMMHVVAMGAHPCYPPNRNGDAFSRETLLETHPTFVKHAKFFREHNNKDASNNLGFVKASAYNTDLDRVELLVHGHKERAEQEYEMAKAGKELSVSMASSMPYDECSCCFNRAKNVASYCSHLSDHMNQYLPEFRKYAFAFNPKPKFFDISRVNRPADRIAHYLEYVFGDEQDSLNKAASEISKGGIVIPGATWATYEGFSQDEEPELPEALSKLASELESLEQWYAGTMPEATPKYHYAHDVVRKALVQSNDLPDVLTELSPGVLLRKLAASNVVLPFDVFWSYIDGKSLSEVHSDPEFVKQSTALPQLFTLFNRQMSESLVKLAQSFEPSTDYVCQETIHDYTGVRNTVDDLAQQYSFSPDHVRARAMRSNNVPRTGVVPLSNELGKMASAYACYQLQTLVNSKADDTELLGVIGANRFRVEKY